MQKLLIMLFWTIPLEHQAGLSCGTKTRRDFQWPGYLKRCRKKTPLYPRLVIPDKQEE